MSRSKADAGKLVAFGLGWSIVLFLSLERIPAIISAGQAYGGSLALTGAALVLLTAKRQCCRRTAVIFALVLLFLLGTSAAGAITILLGTAAVLGWVRSSRGLSARDAFSPTAELVTGVGTIGLAAGVAPTSSLVIALCIWLFYLWQIIPLVVSDRKASLRSARELRRQFEAIRQRVERILAARI